MIVEGHAGRMADGEGVHPPSGDNGLDCLTDPDSAIEEQSNLGGLATRSARGADYFMAEIARGDAVVRVVGALEEGRRVVRQRAFHRAADGVLIAAPLGSLLAPEAAERVIEALEEAAR